MTSASLPQLLRDTVLSPDFRRATFGGSVRGTPTEWVRVVLRPVELRGQPHVQFSYFNGKNLKYHVSAVAAKEHAGDSR